MANENECKCYLTKTLSTIYMDLLLGKTRIKVFNGFILQYTPFLKMVKGNKYNLIVPSTVYFCLLLWTRVILVFRFKIRNYTVQVWDSMTWSNLPQNWFYTSGIYVSFKMAFLNTDFGSHIKYIFLISVNYLALKLHWS